MLDLESLLRLRSRGVRSKRWCGLGFREFRVQGSGFRVQGLGFGVRFPASRVLVTVYPPGSNYPIVIHFPQTYTTMKSTKIPST